MEDKSVIQDTIDLCLWLNKKYNNTLIEPLSNIDFEEFMKHFNSVLDMIHFNQQLQGILEKDKNTINENAAEMNKAGQATQDQI